VKKLLPNAALVALLCCGVSGKTANVISLRLSVPHHTYKIGKPIPAYIEISNKGKETLLVCRDLTSPCPCYLEFETRDHSGGWKSAADGPDGPPEPFPKVLISNWIALAPNSSYGKQTDVWAAFESKPRPGRYKLRAILSSFGPNEDSMNNELRVYPEEVAALPYSGWKGEVDSNWVWIDIVTGK
jgi:hypothetical protein